MSHKKMKFMYFDGRGRGELTRYVFKLAGKNFEDIRVKQESWPSLKKTTPVGSMPVLQCGDHTLVQSTAIARFVARELGVCGVNSWEQAVCDMMTDTCAEVITAGAGIAFAPSEEEKDKAREKTKAAMANFEKLVSMHKKGTFILGSKPSLADAAVTAALDMVKATAPDALEKHPNLAAVYKSFTAVPAIAAWIKARPATPF